ncbi:MAG: hypothetical protein V2I27_15570 [Erythrobacter sp.]|nr:hypothetical protein [Erythrobacter sp.]
MTMMQRPGFLKSLLESWQLTLDHGKARDLVPYWIIGSGLIGAAVAYFLPTNFWDRTKPDVSVAVLSGLLTFNGIILALCWSAFGKIYEIIGAGAFSKHLRKHKLLNHYLLFVGYCHAAQIVAIALTAFALFALWLPLEVWAIQISVGASVAGSIYALRQGVATSTAMQDLIWRKAMFDEAAPEVKSVEATA